MRGLLVRQLGRPSGLVGRLVLAPMWNRRNRALNDAAFNALALRPGGRVLEVGFGGGYLLRRMAAALPGDVVHAVDASPEMVAYCRRRYRALVDAGRLDLRRASADALPFADGQFTHLVSVNSLFYWPNVPAAFAEFQRVVAGGGRLVLVFTDRQSIEAGRFTRQGVAAYDAAQIEAMLAAAGFGSIRVVEDADRHRTFVCLSAIKS